MKYKTAEKILEDWMIGWVHFYVLFFPLGVMWAFAFDLYAGIAALVAWSSGLVATRLIIRKAWETVGENHPLVDTYNFISSLG